METFNITPLDKKKRAKRRTEPDNKMELLEFNMTQGDSLEFDPVDKNTYFRVNINFKYHTISRILCLN